MTDDECEPICLACDAESEEQESAFVSVICGQCNVHYAEEELYPHHRVFKRQCACDNSPRITVWSKEVSE